MLFRSTITGSDLVLVDDKREKLFTGRAICKFMITANKKPAIENVNAHRRRLIFATMSPVTGTHIPPNVYNKMLDDEGHAFLSKCWALYVAKGQGRKIQNCDDTYKALLEENEVDFQEIVDRWLVADPTGCFQEMDIRHLLRRAGQIGRAHV